MIDLEALKGVIKDSGLSVETLEAIQGLDTEPGGMSEDDHAAAVSAAVAEATLAGEARYNEKFNSEFWASSQPIVTTTPVPEADTGEVTEEELDEALEGI